MPRVAVYQAGNPAGIPRVPPAAPLWPGHPVWDPDPAQAIWQGVPVGIAPETEPATDEEGARQ